MSVESGTDLQIWMNVFSGLALFRTLACPPKIDPSGQLDVPREDRLAELLNLEFRRRVSFRHACNVDTDSLVHARFTLGSSAST